ncbi:MAG: hypothetical protein GY896_21835 [Gammaproteobacteria bacterium]|nr:hypothetical protein [Gammaproteobacteria bacterium]
MVALCFSRQSVSKGESVLKFIKTTTIGGIAFANLLALLAIVVVCFVAGMIARSPLAKRFYQAIDNGLLSIPGYAFVKAYTDSMKLGQAEAKACSR